MKLRVAILYGGVSAEHEVSVVSARCVLEAIDRTRYDVVAIGITKEGRWLLPRRSPEQLPAPRGVLPAVAPSDGDAVVLHRVRGVPVVDPVEGSAATAGAIDVVFPVLHGPGGEDGTVQGLLETLGVPYVGAGVAASAVGMDKALQKPVFAAAGIPVVEWAAVRALDFAADPRTEAERAVARTGFPCFTKPAALGSSVGVAKCRTIEEVVAGVEAALGHGRAALVERAVGGRELECAVLGNDEPEASVVGEIVTAPGHEFYDYEAKYLEEGSRAIIPADVPPAVAESVRRYAIAAFRAIGCAGLARVDFFLEGDRVICNEINTIPGFTPISMYPKLWEASGIPYPKLIDRLVELALERARP